ncbi:MAG: hypothetical protein ACR2IQ_02460 [Minisyncoccia bacterium]
MYSIKNITTVFFTLIVFLIPLSVSAITIKKTPSVSFGGRIITTRTPGIVCTGQYWLTTVPNGGFPIPTPLVIEATNKTITPGINIIGLVDTVPDMNNCFIPTPTGPIYIPSWRVDTKNIGVSKLKPNLRK